MQTHTKTIEREERFMLLLKPLLRRAERFALSLVNNRDDAKDLLQDAIVTVWQHFDDIRDVSSFRSYLYAVMSNLNKRQYRKREREQPFAEGAEENIESFGMSSEAQLDASIVREAVNQLPPKSKEAILLYEVHDLPVAEIAVIQQCSVSAVKVRLMRARHSLAIALGVNNESVLAQSPTPTLQ